MAGGPGFSAESAWGPALAAALVGAERAQTPTLPDPFADLAGTGDAGGELLARVAALGTYRLAGGGLSADALDPFAPLEPVAPECPPAAAQRLAELLGQGASANRHVAEWCGLAAERGLRAPAELLALLDLRRGTASDREAIDPVAGVELDWLRRVCAGEEAQAPATEDAASGEPAEDWTEGDATARRWAFAAFRRRDPDAARASLEPVFRGEKAELREHLVGALEIGLSPADEPFLEACLDDRAGGVRAAAQRLLAWMPGSRLKRRMAERVQAALRLTATRKLLGGTKHELAVELPQESPELARDGVAPNPYASRKTGPGADMLAQILKLAPLSAYAGHPQRVWVEAALRSDWSEPIVEGMVTALRRERDPPWRDALIGTLREACGGRLSGVKPTDAMKQALAQATGALPAPDWEEAVAAVLRTRDLDIALRLLDDGPASFSERFTAALFDWLATVGRGHASWLDALWRSGVLQRLGHRAHPGPDSEAAAASVLARLPEDAQPYLRQQFVTFSETVSLRTAMRREFSP